LILQLVSSVSSVGSVRKKRYALYENVLVLA
jgi:hypothetical protein